MFPGIGTVVNVAAVLLGATLGVLLGNRLPQRTRELVTDALGLVTLLIAGHGIGVAAIVEWSLFGGCVLTAFGVLVALARQPRPEQQPVTVRGPVGYAGPGSLGGTESALRR